MIFTSGCPARDQDRDHSHDHDRAHVLAQDLAVLARDHHGAVDPAAEIPVAKISIAINKSPIPEDATSPSLVRTRSREAGKLPLYGKKYIYVLSLNYPGL